MKFFSSDFAFKVINQFDLVVKSSIKFSNQKFGIVGHLLVSPLISLLSLTIYLITFFLGIVIFFAISLVKISMRKIRSLLRSLARSILFWVFLYIGLIIFFIINHPIIYIALIIVSLIIFGLEIKSAPNLNTPRR